MTIRIGITSGPVLFSSVQALVIYIKKVSIKSINPQVNALNENSNATGPAQAIE